MSDDPNKISKSFCSLAWTELHVTPIGIVKPCCVFDGSIKNNEGEVQRISDRDVSDIWNNKHFRDIRTKMLKGETIPECRKCIEEEKVYSSSDRIKFCSLSNDVMKRVKESQENDGTVKELPSMLNLKMGNTCNLKCRMCQPLDSNSVDQEFTAISKKDPLFRGFDNTSAFDYYYDKEPIETAANWVGVSLSESNIRKMIQGTKILSLAGGETVYTRQAVELLNYCVGKKLAPDMELNLSTNITRISDELISTLSAFRVTHVLASIDGVNETLEYIRHPSKWSQVRVNLIKLIKSSANIYPIIAPTIQIYNVLDIAELLQEIEDYGAEFKPIKWEQKPPFHLTILFTPNFLNIRYLPDTIKKIALKRIEKFYQASYYVKRHKIYNEQMVLLMETLKQSQPERDSLGNTATDYLAHFVKYTEVLDEHRDQSWKDSLPELFGLMAAENIKPAYPKQDDRTFSYYKYRDAGYAYQKEGKSTLAIVMFQKAMELNNHDKDLQLAIFHAYRDAGFKYQENSEPLKAIEMLKAALELQDDNVLRASLFYAYADVGYASQKEGMFLRAIELFKIALELNEDAGLRNSLFFVYRDAGFAFQKDGQNAKAIEMFQRAYEINSHEIHLLFALGVAFKEEAQTEEAENFFKKAFLVDSKHYYNLMELGYIELAKNNHESAQKYFQLAREIEPVERAGYTIQFINKCFS